MPPRNVCAFTLIELLVVIGVIFIFLVFLDVFPPQDQMIRKGQLIQAVNNARQIHIATMSMAADGEANKDVSLGWPGDLKANGKIQNIQDFVSVLVKNDYLKPMDLKIFASAGIQPYIPTGSNGIYTPPFENKNSAFKVFLVRKDDPEKEIFLTTKNYTYNTALDPKAKPFGKDGFVVAHKAGDVSMYKKKLVNALEVLGPLPGGATAESAANCLNPAP